MSAGFCAAVIMAMLITPPVVVYAVFAAAALHELGHLAALSHYGVPVRALRLTALGAELDAVGVEKLSYGRELVVTLAGVTVNLLSAALLAAAGEWFQTENLYLFAGAHLVLAAFNLLPIAPLDGGHALYLAVAYFAGPLVGDAVTAVVGTAFSLVLLALGLKLTVLMGSGWLFLLAALGLSFGAFGQLGLAKNAVKV